MFNQLTPSEVVTAIGATLRRAARSDNEPSDFERDQLMSAYSASRHLAVELAAYGPELERFTAAVQLALTTVADPELLAELAPLASELDARQERAAYAATVCDALALLRSSASPAALGVRSELHQQLRLMADREVALLADALG